MSTNKYHSLREIYSGSFNWKIKVRIIRIWRGISRSGDSFKGFNVMFLDEKNDRLHGFVPSSVAEKLGDEMIVGKIVKMFNFTVKDYKKDEKFRPIHSEKQIILTNFTEIESLDEVDVMIGKDMFDFYDLGDLKDIANDNTYLTDVIGVIEKDFPLSKVGNKFGNVQSQIKFKLTDGRCSKNVTFWDSLAEEFSDALMHVVDFPPIVIISSAKITSWQDSIDIGNVTATCFYINYDHHSVRQMRSMISSDLFSQHDFSTQMPEQFDKLSVEQIMNAGSQYADKEIICDLQIIFPEVLGTSWFYPTCTSCYKEINPDENEHQCIICSRIVPYPDKKFSLYVEGVDETGSIDVILNDQVVRTLIGQTVHDLHAMAAANKDLPEILRTIGNKFYTVKLLIKAQNIAKIVKSYHILDMYEIGLPPTVECIQDVQNEAEAMTEDSTSTFHLDGLSQLNFQTPEVTNKKKKRFLKNINS